MVIIFCIPSDTRHYLATGISFLYVHDGEGKGYAIDLVDKKPDPLPTFSGPLLVYNKRLFDAHFPGHETYDLETHLWLTSQQTIALEDRYQLFLRFYREYKKPYSYIPFLKHVEFCEESISRIGISNIQLTTADSFYQKIVYPAISGIEGNGLCIDLPRFNTLFEKNYQEPIVHCHYNLHTTTGRPSNTNDGINYAALSKKNDRRKCFISRFNGGKLIEFDFDSYHLRIIGDRFGYELPRENIYVNFGREFYGQEITTEEQYARSKNLTFSLLYSELSSQYRHVSFFKYVDDMKNALWDLMNTHGYINSPCSKRILRKNNYPDIDRSKLFNYVLQMLETEYSMLTIHEILKILQDKKSKLILYTYDSFLLDYSPEDPVSMLHSIKEIMKHASVKEGLNYYDLKPVLY